MSTRILLLLVAGTSFTRSCATGQPQVGFQSPPVCEPVMRQAPADTPQTSFQDQVPSPYLLAARRVPGGFAGIRHDEKAHRWFLQLVDTSQAGAARAFLLQSAASGEGVLTANLSREDVESSGVEGALWTLGELHDWLRYVTPLVLGDATAAGAVVYGVGVSPARNRLAVQAGNERSRATIDSILASRKVPGCLVITEIGMPINLIRWRGTDDPA